MYSNNKQLPRIRRDVATFALRNGIRTASIHFGYAPSAIHKWIKEMEKKRIWCNSKKSSRPKSHPKQTSKELEQKIVNKRLETKRSSEVVHKYLEREGIKVSLSTVKRILNKRYLIKKRSPWKRFHPRVDRPAPKYQGDLVELDSIHLMIGKKSRIYVMTIIDVHSRFAYAFSYEKISSKQSVNFVKRVEKYFPFKLQMLQTDHGSEFGKHFQDHIQEHHRFTRIGRPNDNAHIERFNRTIQEEFLDKLPKKVSVINKRLTKYLEHYNKKRLHFGIDFKTPQEVLDCSQAID